MDPNNAQIPSPQIVEVAMDWDNLDTAVESLFGWNKSQKSTYSSPQVNTADASKDDASTTKDLNDSEMASSAYALTYQKERQTVISDTLLNYVLRDSQFYILLAMSLFLRYIAVVSISGFLFCFSLIPFIAYMFANYAPILFLEDDIKWIRGESKLLSALLKDVDGVLESGAQIDARAKEIWNSELDPEKKTVNLLKNEVDWVDIVRDVVSSAEQLVLRFEQRKRSREFSERVLGMFTGCLKAEELFWESKQVKDEMINCLDRKTNMGCVDICGSLEKSRCIVKSLQARPIDEHKSANSQQVESKAEMNFAVVEKLNMGDQFESVKLQLKLLHAFLKDTEELQLESEIEKAWVEEAKEIIKKAQEALNAFSWRPGNQMGWLLIFLKWIAMCKLKGKFKFMDIEFSELFNRKDRYGFTLIRRVPSKSMSQKRTQTDDDDREISRVVVKIQYWAEQLKERLSEVLYGVQSLCELLEKMQMVLAREKEFEGRSNSRILWSQQTKFFSCQAEDYIDNYLKDTKDKNHRRKIIEAEKFSNKIDRIRHFIDLLEKSVKAYHTEQIEEACSIVGLEEDIYTLVSKLTSNSDHLSFISIVGMKGIGKTTLAKKIYNHRAVVDHFAFRGWVSVPEICSESELLEDVVKQIVRPHELTKPKGENLKEHWSKELDGFLMEKRYLIVLDNISEMEELKTLKGLFPETTNSSKIVLTTRNNDLGLQVKESNDCYYLRLRTKEESVELFRQMVHFTSDVETLVKQIVGRCGGLPLSVLRLGYLLSGKEGIELQEWFKVLECIKNEKTPLLEPFRDAIKDLPPHLMSCLSYFELFPREFEIPVRRLVALWIAEGLGVHETPESLGEKHLLELINRNMVQVVERKLNGKIKICCLPTALRELWLQEGTSLKQGKLADHLDRNQPYYEHIHGNSTNSQIKQTYKNLVSFFSFDTQEGNRPGEDIGNFLSKGIARGIFQKLKVLDLERVFRPHLPNTIGKLTQLRYLGLRWTYLETIPSSIGELVDLQTLDVKHTNIRILPSSIWKLQKLRHLYLSQSYRSKFVQQPSKSSLKDLQTLWGVFVDEESPLENGLYRLTKLRKLGLALKLTEAQQKELAKWICQLKHLETLRLRSINDMGEPEVLNLEILSGLQFISSLYLFGRLLSPSYMNNLPQSLTELTLSASKLSYDPIPMLEKLKKLKLLCFYSDSYIGKKMLFSAEGFPHLLVLKLWKLDSLEKMDIRAGAMRNIRDIEIRYCTKLDVPSGFVNLKTLLQLKLTNMPDDFTAKIEENKAKIWDSNAYSLDIIVANWQSMPNGTSTS